MISLEDLWSTSHKSTKPSHYDERADSYDAFNEERSKTINECLERILKRNPVKRVLDISCGTGSQVFWLIKSGFDVIGADFNSKMLEIARRKVAEADLDVKFLEADMRSIRLDASVDAVISIFNAIGHLSREDFERVIKNTARLLKTDGLFIFDIFNLNYLLHEDRITNLTIDWQKETNDGRERILQFSTIDHEGILASYTTVFQLGDSRSFGVRKSRQTLQVYSASQLVDILDRLGLDTVEQTDIDGSEFSDIDTERILTVARKRRSNGY